MQKQAEGERDAALAEKEAQDQLRLAQAATATAEQQSRDAEEEQVRLEQVAEDARQELIQVQAQQVFLDWSLRAGNRSDAVIRATHENASGMMTVTPVTFSEHHGLAANPWAAGPLSQIAPLSNAPARHVYQ